MARRAIKPTPRRRSRGWLPPPARARVLALLLPLALSANACSGGSGNLTGFVTDGGKPVPNANIDFEPASSVTGGIPEIAVATNQDGFFIVRTASGDYRVTARSGSRQSEPVTASVTAEETVEVRLELAR